MNNVGAAFLSIIIATQCAFAASSKAHIWPKEPASVLGLQLLAPLASQAGLVECPRIPGRYSGEARDESFQGFCYERPAEADKYTSWKTYNPPALANYNYTLHIVVRAGILHGVEISVPREQSDSFLQTLVERYGKPEGMSKAALQNGFGAVVSSRSFNWTGRKISMSYDEYGDGMNNSLTVILTHEFMGAVDAQRAQQRKDAGAKL